MNKELGAIIIIFCIIIIISGFQTIEKDISNEVYEINGEVNSINGIHKTKESVLETNEEHGELDDIDSNNNKEEIRIEKVTIASVGDIMCHSPQFRSVYKEGVYDFTGWFEPIKKHIEFADIAIGNLETTFSGKEKGFSGFPRFNAPEQLGDALKYAGFDIITTANNHSLDRNNYGIVSTLDNLDKSGLLHIGTYRNEDESEKLLIMDTKGIKIAFMNYTYGTNGIPIPKNNPHAVNIINKEKMLLDINKAKELGSDVIVFYLHFGQEYVRKPSSEQKELVDILFQNGVDIVLGSHPHVIQPMEFKEYKSDEGQERKCFVIYSQGNFISNQRDKYCDSGLITIINIEKNFNTNKTEISHVDFIPTWVDKSYTKDGIIYRILDVEKAIEDYEGNRDELLIESDYERLKNVLEETNSVLKGIIK